MTSFMDRYKDIAIPDYVRKMATQGGDRRGTASLIDKAATSRAFASVRSRRSVSLSRPLEPGQSIRNDGAPAFSLTPYVDREGTIDVLSEHVEMDSHGYLCTHVDALSHFAVGGTFYGGIEEDHSSGFRPSVMDWAGAGLVTRGVFVDVPAIRGVQWVSLNEPVVGEDIDRALAKSSVEFLPGDALLLYMGRDRLEASGHKFTTAFESPEGRPGVGSDAAKWIARHGVSILCWDMMDAVHTVEPLLSVHLLIWAIGLVLVDNCDFADAREVVTAAGSVVGMLIVAPLKVPGGTASPVSPLFIV